MKAFELTEIIEKLIGEVEPVGSTHIDDERFENLKELCELTNTLVRKIDDIYFQNKDSKEYSVKRAAEYADDFMSKTLGIPE